VAEIRPFAMSSGRALIRRSGSLISSKPIIRWANFDPPRKDPRFQKLVAGAK
jgi:hypothetical protein